MTGVAIVFLLGLIVFNLQSIDRKLSDVLEKMRKECE